MIAHIAARIGFAVLGYFAGILTGSAAFPCALALIGLMFPGNQLWEWLGLGPVMMVAVPIFFFVLMWITVIFTFVQAIIAHALTEFFALRRLWVHLGLAVAIALSAGLILYPQWFADMSLDRWLFSVAALIGALTGGLVYWAIAGRNAGLRAAAPA